MIESEANPNAISSWRNGPLYNFGEDGNQPKVKRSIVIGASISITVGDEAAPIFIVCQNGHQSIVFVVDSNWELTGYGHEV